MRRLIFILLAGAMVVAPAVVSAQTTTPTVTPRPTINPTAESTAESTETPAPVEYLLPKVLNTYPHDTTAFTEGLLYHDGKLYESAGETGKSDLREVDLKTGEVLQRTLLSPESFAEGLAMVDDRLIQLTWKEETAFIYDLDTFQQEAAFSYTGEGWGLCYDGNLLWKSDGTSTLTAHDTDTFAEVRDVVVTYQGYPVDQVATQTGRTLGQINELECADGFIYANVWFTDYILKIDPETGDVTGVINASQLITDEERQALMSVDTDSVLNGIAYNPDTETFYLTGKNWPSLFEVQFEPPTTP